MKRYSIFLVVLSAIAIVAVFLAIQPSPIAIGVQPASINYPMMYTIESGLFSEAVSDLEVRVFTSANDALDALLVQDVVLDAAIPLQNIVEIEETSPGLLGIAAFIVSDSTHPLDYLVVPIDSPIDALSDLSGKTLVVFPGTYSEHLTRLTLERLGISDVSFIKRGPAEMSQALRTGAADAGIFYDPAASQAVSEGWARILESAFWERHLIPELVVGAYTFNKEFQAEEPETFQALMGALQKGIVASRQNPREAKRSVAAFLPGFSEELWAAIPDSRILLSSEIDYDLIERTLVLYADLGLIDRPIDLQPLFFEGNEKTSN